MGRQMECAREQTWRQFVAGELAAPESESLQSNAANCSSCGELVRHLRQLAADPADQHLQTPSEQIQPADLLLANTKSFLNTKDGVPHDWPEFDLDAELAEAAFDASL